MKKAKPDTILTHAGNNPRANHGIVNPPVWHASTVLFPSLAALDKTEADAIKEKIAGLREYVAKNLIRPLEHVD